MNSKTRLATLLILWTASSATGCEHAPLHPRPMCPILTEWTAEDSQELAEEVALYAPAAPNMERAVSELYVLRRQCGRKSELAEPSK